MTSQAELANWVALGKATRPPTWNSIMTTGDIILQPAQTFDLFFKYLTFREVALGANEPGSKDQVRPRKIQIIVFMASGAVY